MGNKSNTNIKQLALKRNRGSKNSLGQLLERLFAVKSSNIIPRLLNCKNILQT